MVWYFEEGDVVLGFFNLQDPSTCVKALFDFGGPSLTGDRSAQQDISEFNNLILEV